MAENARDTPGAQRWRASDAADYPSSAREEQALSPLYDAYEGPLGWTDWLREYRRDRELERAGIVRPELPAGYADALGDQRAWRLIGLVEDRLLSFDDAPPGREELSAQAGDLEAASEGLDIALGRQVAELERQRMTIASRCGTQATGKPIWSRAWT